MERKNCLICSAPTRVTHLGIEACRACAAFFKRTKIAGRKFTCRQGNGKCVIRKHEKFMCRRCRYDKCVAFGMRFVPRKKLKIRVEKAEAAEMRPSSSSPSDCPQNSSDSLIDRMGSQIEASFDRRLVLEKEYAKHQNLPRFGHPTEELYKAGDESLMDLFRISLKDSTSYLGKVFDDFDTLPIFQRATLFKNYYMKFSTIECVYLTAKYFDQQNIFMTSLITCAESKDIDNWMSDNEKIERKEAFRSTVKNYTREYETLYGSLFKMDAITEREFHALALLSYCDADVLLHLPDGIVSNMAAIRSRVFAELQDYYRKELKMHDFSQRIANLMTLVHGAGEAGLLMEEEMRMYATMFDLYADDQLLREFFSF